MNPVIKKIRMLTALMALLVIVGLTGCEIDQTQAGDMPDVDVDVEADPGQLPAYDIDGPDVNVGTTTKMVKVPKVVVVMEEEEVEVPYIDVDVPGEDKMEQTIVVETEVRGEGYELDIEEAYVVGNELWVISELEAPDMFPEERPTMRISDRLVLNAPDLRVKHFIIGDKPDGFHNGQYTFINSMADIESDLMNGKRLYSIED